MSMFDDGELHSNNNQEPEKTFEPAGDDYLESYLTELDQPKQEQPAPDLPPDEDYIEEEAIEAEEVPYSPRQYETSQTTARFVVKTADDLISLAFTTFALEKDSKQFKAEKTELDEISEHLSVYFAENSMNLPPWVMAAIPGVMVLSNKFNVAVKLRKVNLEKKKTEDELAEVKKELERVTLEKRVAEAKSELDKLKND